jgi:CRISPR/Cas system endoribonuclease Cas6 (RAMP superfamily)
LKDGRQLDALVLVRAVLRRQLQWNQLSGQAAQPAEPFLQAAMHCVLDAGQLQWHEISRYSNTQSQKLPLDGLIGTALLTGPAGALQTLQPLLQLGELLHIGKATVFGLGCYQMRVN